MREELREKDNKADELIEDILKISPADAKEIINKLGLEIKEKSLTNEAPGVEITD